MEGLQRTSAGLGSVIIDSQPLTVALLASLLFGERLGVAGAAGLLVGVAGLCLLEVPPSVLASLPDSLAASALQLASSSGGEAGSVAGTAAALASSSAAAAGGLADAAAAAGTAAAAAADGGSQGEWSIWDSGEWWMLLAAQSMAVGTVMVRWVAKYCDPVVATGEPRAARKYAVAGRWAPGKRGLLMSAIHRRGQERSPGASGCAWQAAALQEMRDAYPPPCVVELGDVSHRIPRRLAHDSRWHPAAGAGGVAGGGRGARPPGAADWWVWVGRRQFGLAVALQRWAAAWMRSKTKLQSHSVMGSGTD